MTVKEICAKKDASRPHCVPWMKSRVAVILLVSQKDELFALTNLSSVSAVLPCITVPPSVQAELEDKIRVLKEKVGVLEEKLEKETTRNKIELDRKLQMLEKKFEKKIKICVLEEKICTLETTKTKMGEKIYMLEKSHEKKILELEKKMCSLMAPGPSIPSSSIHPSFLSKLANATEANAGGPIVPNYL